MKRRFTHIGLLFFIALIAFQLLNKTIYALYFICNQTAIAAEHCVNKERPEVKCDGRCHLKKYLAQESMEEEQDGPGKSPFWQSFEDLPLQFLARNSDLELNHVYLFFNEFEEELMSEVFGLSSPYHPSVFHPPTA